MVEEWRDVVGYEGRYLVSSLGRIASLHCARGLRKNPKVLRLKTNRYGYRVITLTDERHNRKYPTVHLLVCEAFNGPRPHGYVCRHLGGSTTNNIPANLAWGTVKQNKRDSIGHGTWAHGEKFGRSKLKEHQVIAILADGRTQQAIADDYGVTQTCIQKIKAGLSWKHLHRESPNA